MEIFSDKVKLRENAYPIFIGNNILKSFTAILKQYDLSRKIVLVTHPLLYHLYGKELEEALALSGYTPFVVHIPEGEESKTLKQVEKIFDDLIDFGIDRKSALLALGGGVVGDITGFVAATYLRGLPYFQIPTTLLAQVDSSIGGKTGVNHPKAKNIIGSIYQPKLVLIDLQTLSSLPDREYRSGLGEVIKYGLIMGPIFFAFLENHMDEIVKRDTGRLFRIIKKCSAYKARIVAKDEKERLGLRAILNFGHTVAHGLEAILGYGELRHGEAVALGMIAACSISHRLGFCPESIPQRVALLIRRAGLPVSIDIPPDKLDKLITTLLLDKKVENGRVKLVLLEQIGQTVLRDDIPESLIRQAVIGLTKGLN